MRVNIKNNEIASIDFLNVDEAIEFIQKFNKDRNKEESDRNSVEFDKIADKIINSNRINQEPIPVWYQYMNDSYVQRINTQYSPEPNQFKVEDPIPYPYTITSATK